VRWKIFHLTSLVTGQKANWQFIRKSGYVSVIVRRESNPELRHVDTSVTEPPPPAVALQAEVEMKQVTFCSCS